jgi:tetratricopeptide (TPR) repeat protein/predicted DNA-binding transcriptional regulator
LVASLLTAVWPTAIAYSQEARQYALVGLFAGLAIYCLYRGLTESSAKGWVGYTLAMTAALYTHYFAFLWLGAHGVFLLAFIALSGANKRSRFPVLFRRTILPFALSCAACALAYIPWYLGFLAQSHRLIGEDAGSGQSLSFIMSFVSLGDATMRFMAADSTALSVALWIAMLLGLLLALLKRRWIGALYAVVCLTAPAVAFGFVSSPHFFHPRYLFPLLIPVILLVTPGLLWPGQLARAVSNRRAYVGPVITAGILVITVIALLYFDAAYYRKQKEDWRGAISYLARHKAPADVIIGDGLFYGQGGDALRVQQGIGYYLGDQNVVILAEPGLADRLPADVRAAGAAWGVIWDQGQHLRKDLLSADWDIVSFFNVTVFRLKRSSGLLHRDVAAVLEAMLQILPFPETHADLHLALTELYSKLGEPVLADAHFAKAQTLAAAGDPALRQSLERVKASITLRAAQGARATGDVGQARSAYAELLKGDLDPAQRFAVLMEWAIMERFQPNPSAAIELLEQALQLRPDDVEAHANYGAVLLAADRPAEAAREFEIVVSKSPQHFWGYYYGGLAYQRSNRPDATLAAFQRAIELAPDEPLRNAVIGEALKVAGQLKDCEAGRRIAAKFPASPALNNDDVRAFLLNCR